MATSFAALKKSRSSSLSKLVTETAKINAPSEGSNEDNRFWTPSVDKAGNGYAVIRFMPPAKGEEMPFVRIWDHGFQGPGGWYIEKSLTTLGQKDPVSEANTLLWNSGVESDKKIARDRKRKLRYVSNILVVKDPANPDNEGKVFLFEYGKKIHDKIIEKLSPPEVPDGFTPEDPVNEFEFEDGANFMLQAAQVSGYRNYDKSKFDNQSSLFDGEDSKLEKVYNSLHSLQELVAPSEFKTYDELKAKFDKVVHGVTTTSSAETAQEEDVDLAEKMFGSKSSVTEDVEQTISTGSDESETTETVEQDDALSYFEKLSQED